MKPLHILMSYFFKIHLNTHRPIYIYVTQALAFLQVYLYNISLIVVHRGEKLLIII